MPSIARGQECTTSILNWFILVNGTKTDAFDVGCQIWDISGGLPGSVVWPTPGDDTAWENVTNAPGKFSVGSYYPYDNTLGAGWTPALGEPLGDHLIKWRWKITAAAPYMAGQEAFTVLAESSGTTQDEYITVQQVRDEGVPLPADGGPSDDEILALIQLFSGLVDKVTRCFFTARTFELRLDGSGHDTLFLPWPVIEITAVEVNLLAGTSPRSGTVLTEDQYEVYNRDLPNDKRTPRIELVSQGQSIYAGTDLGNFAVGTLNQRISGTFGWVENGQVPLPIQQAMKRLVIRNLGKLATGEGGSESWGGGGAAAGSWGILEEQTDRHRIKFTDAKAGEGMGADATALQLINDPVAYAMIMQYRIATPAIAWSSRPVERGMMNGGESNRRCY